MSMFRPKASWSKAEKGDFWRPPLPSLNSGVESSKMARRADPGWRQWGVGEVVDRRGADWVSKDGQMGRAVDKGGQAGKTVVKGGQEGRVVDKCGQSGKTMDPRAAEWVPASGKQGEIACREKGKWLGGQGSLFFI